MHDECRVRSGRPASGCRRSCDRRAAGSSNGSREAPQSGRTRCRAMRLELRAVDPRSPRHAAIGAGGQEDAAERARSAPPDEAVVERCVRTMAARLVLLHRPIADHGDEAADRAAIIQPMWPTWPGMESLDPPHRSRRAQHRIGPEATPTHKEAPASGRAWGRLARLRPALPVANDVAMAAGEWRPSVLSLPAARLRSFAILIGRNPRRGPLAHARRREQGTGAQGPPDRRQAAPCPTPRQAVRPGPAPAPRGRNPPAPPPTGG